MRSSNGYHDPPIDKRDFDSHRPLLDETNLAGHSSQPTPAAGRSRAGSRRSRGSSQSGLGMSSDDGLLSDVVDGIVERDRQKMHKEVVRIVSFAWGVITW